MMSLFSGLATRPVEVKRMKVATNETETKPWNESAQLLGLPIDEETLLITYFDIAGHEATVHQSVTLETRQNCGVVTLSLHPRLVEGSGSSASKILAGMAGWAMDAFDAAALACGPELDLSEIGDDMDVQKIEQRFASVGNCWITMSVHRFPGRMFETLH
jgi:hypothetical protein